MNLITKSCKTCNKRFVLNKGFYKSYTNKDEYNHDCKSCHNEKSKKRKAKKLEGNHMLHKYTPFGDLIDKCERCFLLRKRLPLQWKTNQYSYRYLVNNEWSKERPKKCN